MSEAVPGPGEVHIWRVELPPAGGRERGRRALRELLAVYLCIEPEAVSLDIRPGGKPKLAVDPALYFNLSHSGEIALIAIGPGAVEVGVDVEQIRERRDLPRLAARWLSFHDAMAVAAAPPGRREPVFYAAWTRHEARVKCTGAGLGGPPPGSYIRAWPVEIDEGYAAAVALDTRAMNDVEPRIVLKDVACRR